MLFLHISASCFFFPVVLSSQTKTFPIMFIPIHTTVCDGGSCNAVRQYECESPPSYARKKSFLTPSDTFAFPQSDSTSSSVTEEINPTNATDRWNDAVREALFEDNHSIVEEAVSIAKKHCAI